jgi:hypothetical protein
MLVLSTVSALLSLCAWTTCAQAPIRAAAGADNDTAAPSESFSWRDETGESLDLLSNGRRVTRYMYACDPSTTESRQATYKPYHHAFDAAGEGLLTKGPGGLYTHHRGIFIGWNRVLYKGKSYDLWHMTGGLQAHQEFLEKTAAPLFARSKALIHWNTAEGETMLAEERETTVFRQPTDSALLLLEFHTRLKAVSDDVLLDGDPEHAGFHYRPSNDLAENKKAVYLFHRDGIDPRKDRDLPWVALSYPLKNGREYLVQHMNHPGNPSPTVYSAYRDYGRFGAFFTRKIPAGEALDLRYRIWVAEGNIPEDEASRNALRRQMDARHESFASAPQAEAASTEGK